MKKKKKVSIDFLVDNYCLVTKKAAACGLSNSTIINDLVSTFLGLNDDVADSISAHCTDRYADEKSSLDHLSGYHQATAMHRADQYRRIAAYYNRFRADKKMKKTYLSDGYAIYPHDWIVLPDVFGTPPEKCTYAGVIESRNMDKYNIPHFVFFCCDNPAQLSDTAESQVYDACAKLYPDFRRLYNMQVDADPRDPDSLKHWYSAPCFGIFPLVESSADMPPLYDPPYGAMIVRTTPANLQ